jgi:hypothetical protein
MRTPESVVGARTLRTMRRRKGVTIPSPGLGSAWTAAAPDFRGCWEKYERAWEHLVLLRREIEQRDFWTAFEPIQRPWSTPNTADAIDFVCTHVDTPPLRWSTIAGDAIHNLRSALDHLVCQLTMPAEHLIDHRCCSCTVRGSDGVSCRAPGDGVTCARFRPGRYRGNWLGS